MKKILLLLIALISALGTVFATSCVYIDSPDNSSPVDSISSEDSNSSDDSGSDSGNEDSGKNDDSSSGDDSSDDVDIGQREDNETPRIPFD